MTDLERIKKDVVEMDSRANVCWYDTKVLTKAVRLILEELTADRKTEPTISKMEQVDKDINVRSKDEPQTEIEIIACPIVDEFEMCERMYRDEPQTNADQHVQRVESVEPMWTKEKHEAFYTFLWNVINPNEMEDYIGMFESKTETQTERSE